MIRYTVPLKHLVIELSTPSVVMTTTHSTSYPTVWRTIIEPT
jgi:hypothetical protein